MVHRHLGCGPIGEMSLEMSPLSLSRYWLGRGVTVWLIALEGGVVMALVCYSCCRGYWRSGHSGRWHFGLEFGIWGGHFLARLRECRCWDGRSGRCAARRRGGGADHAGGAAGTRGRVARFGAVSPTAGMWELPFCSSALWVLGLHVGWDGMHERTSVVDWWTRRAVTSARGQ